MRGAVHRIRLVGLRLRGGPDNGRPERDAEGRFLQSPTNPPLPVPVREVKGRIGFPRHDEVPDGETIDNAAHLPLGTVVARGDEIEAVGTGDALFDGRYEVVGVSYGRATVRVLLRRHTL